MAFVRKLRPEYSEVSFYSFRAFFGSTILVKSPRNVLVPVADGSEELETISIVNPLRRAGNNVVIASVSDSLMVKVSIIMVSCSSL